MLHDFNLTHEFSLFLTCEQCGGSIFCNSQHQRFYIQSVLGTLFVELYFVRFFYKSFSFTFLQQSKVLFYYPRQYFYVLYIKSFYFQPRLGSCLGASQTVIRQAALVADWVCVIQDYLQSNDIVDKFIFFLKNQIVPYKKSNQSTR